MSITTWLLAAVLLQGALTFLLLGVLSFVRVHLLRTGFVRAADVRLSREPWPDQAKQASNAFDNQFQLPLLFYVATAISIYFAPTGIEAALAWVFVLSRGAHAAIYVINNHVPSRATAFSIGYAALMGFWIDLIIRLGQGAVH